MQDELQVLFRSFDNAVDALSACDGRTTNEELNAAGLITAQSIADAVAVAKRNRDALGQIAGNMAAYLIDRQGELVRLMAAAEKRNKSAFRRLDPEAQRKLSPGAAEKIAADVSLSEFVRVHARRYADHYRLVAAEATPGAVEVPVRRAGSERSSRRSSSRRVLTASADASPPRRTDEEAGGAS